MNPVELRAKSPDLQHPNGISLAQHTRDVIVATRVICGLANFVPDLSRAAFYHDLGKAAAFFQSKMFGAEPPNWYRHELFSLLAIISFEYSDRLSFEELAAIATHHRNLDHDDLVSWMENDALAHIKKLASIQLKPNWQECCAIFGKLPSRLDVLGTINYLKRLKYVAENNTVWSQIGRQLYRYRGVLVASDHLASSGIGVTNRGYNININALTSYASRSFRNRKNGLWSVMQRACIINNSTMLVAPTGSGKTEAALLWALHNRKEYERIFYVLPYQVSINAMASRLGDIFQPPICKKRRKISDKKVVLHSNHTISILHSNTALAYLQDAMNDGVSSKQSAAGAKEAAEAARKIYAPLKVTTVYQLLNIFFGRKFFEVGLLELTGSLVVFDEIHAYDGHTLGLILVLLDCLHKLGARVFIMTATLPKSLSSMLQDAAHISDNNVVMLKQGDSLLNEERRKIYLHSTLIEGMTSQIRAAVESKKRVVVVCNTVDKAIALSEALKDLSPMLIHSRFCIGHRAERETKENLRVQPFVISTQVIEVSLDVSFDIMFTELAPVDDLLQRFGRVNRHGVPDPNNLGICRIALAEDASSEVIYSKELLDATRRVLLEDANPAIGNIRQTLPLDYNRACDWIERVYPNGLPQKEAERLEVARAGFQRCVDNLRPMVDAAEVDIEKNLFNSVQVVPAKYANDWRKMKEQRKHIEAKRLIVSVDERVWSRVCRQHSDSAYSKFCYTQGRFVKEQIIALFPYEEDDPDTFNGTGLRLDRDPIDDPLKQHTIFCGEDDAD